MRFIVIARFCILLVLIVGAGASAQYREIPLPYPDTTRFKVQFVDEMHGWVSSYQGSILQTTDGGVTWKENRFTDDSLFNDIQFVDTRNGWLIVRDKDKVKLYKTSNEGRTWIQRSFPDSTIIIKRWPLHWYMNEPLNIEFIDSNNIFFEGNKFSIRDQTGYNTISWYYTSNGGISWDSLIMPEHTNYYYNVSTINDFGEWIRIDYQSVMEGLPSQIVCYLSSDSGKTWHTTQSWSDVVARSFWRSDSKHFIIFNDVSRQVYWTHPGTFITTDGGGTWGVFPYYNIAKMGVMPQDTVLWAIDLGFNEWTGRNQETRDGIIFRMHPFVSNKVPAMKMMYPNKIRWIDCADQKVFALTADGRLIVFDDLTLSVDGNGLDPSMSVSKSISIYPNPCGSKIITLQYNMIRPGLMSFSIYNAIGARIKEFVPCVRKSSGTYAVDLEVGDLNDGLYYILFSTSEGMDATRFLKYHK